jgi:tRNA-2-methylthio-N6-dimethylallyladenosine synthase
MNSYYIKTFGCQMNEHDSERIAGLLEEKGLRSINDPTSADVIVLNTCCIRENADNKFYGHLGNLKTIKDDNPQQKIVIAGCLAQKEGSEIAKKTPFVDVIVGTHNLHHIGQLLDESFNSNETLVEVVDAPARQDAYFSSDLPAMRSNGYSAWVTIQIGCNNSCGFCIVPSVRGPEVSRPMEEILNEISKLAESGVKEVSLLGQNVNSYGRDINLAKRQKGEIVAIKPMFADLLRSIGKIENIKRVRFTSPHPKDLRLETVEAMASTSSVCEQLHLPMQSGSDRILSMMRRGYTVDKYLQKLSMARAAIDDLAVSTDIIIGYPSETDDDFEETMQAVAEAEFDSAFTFIFSPRPNTLAATLDDEFVSESKKAERMAKLRVIVERSASQKNKLRVGMKEEVLVLGESKKDSSSLTGRTRQGKLIHFKKSAKTSDLSAGDFINVKVIDSSTHYLFGEI